MSDNLGSVDILRRSFMKFARKVNDKDLDLDDALRCRKQIHEQINPNGATQPSQKRREVEQAACPHMFHFWAVASNASHFHGTETLPVYLRLYCVRGYGGPWERLGGRLRVAGRDHPSKHALKLATANESPIHGRG